MLAGCCDEIGNMKPCMPALDVVYESRVCALVLRPERLGTRAFAAGLEGSWSTVADGKSRGYPWPILGLALTASLRRLMPSLFEYCRLAAFSGAEARVGGAVVYFIEPLATHGTVDYAVGALLGDPGLSLAVFEAAQADLARLVDDPDGTALRELRGRAGVTVGALEPPPDELVEQVRAASALMQGLVQDLSSKRELARRMRRGQAIGGGR